VTLPPGYQARSRGSADGFAWATAAGWLATVLEDGATLHARAGSRDDAKPLVGRGTVYAIDAPAAGPDGRPRWAVRRYRRGGLVASILGDRYLRGGVPRPLRELWATVEARARGVPAAAVVAGAVYRTGPFYRGDLVTELVPGARTLEALVFTSGGAVDASSPLAHAGRLVGVMERALVLHVDLNASNVLLVRGGDAPGARVVDLDRAVVFPLGSRPFGEAMRKRLERSLRKLARKYDRPIAPHEWEALRAAYAGGA
jgi:3-deoxy-D-manno-octulosonic acid kinase